MSDWQTFTQYNELADRLIEAASKEQLAEAARVLALNVAHYQARFGEAPTDDLTAMLRAGHVNADSAAMLASGMETFVGVLGSLMGLNQPDNLN